MQAIFLHKRCFLYKHVNCKGVKSPLVKYQDPRMRRMYLQYRDYQVSRDLMVNWISWHRCPNFKKSWMFIKLKHTYHALEVQWWLLSINASKWQVSVISILNIVQKHVPGYSIDQISPLIFWTKIDSKIELFSKGSMLLINRLFSN